MSINLNSLNGSNGFLLDGNEAGDLSGWWVSEAGDINGDGKTDLIMGARRAHGTGVGDSGIAYVVYGSTIPFPADFDVTDINGNNGFLIEGDEVGAQFGRSVASAGDFNNDGIDDLIVGAWLANGNGRGDSGETYIIYGKAGGYSAGLTLSDIDGSNGFRIDGTKFQDWSGWSVAGAGDVNNDGIDDVVLGIWGADPNGETNAGSAQVIFGSSNPFGGAASVDLSALTSSDGFIVHGTNGTIDTGTIVDPGDGFGYAVSYAGDVNGDGIDDIIVGANRDNAGGNPFAGRYDYGAAYVIFGTTTGWPSNFKTSDIDGTNGFALPGYKTLDRSGYAVADAGDVNNDGIDDIIMGNREINNPSFAGEAYLIYGASTTFAASIDLTSLNGTNGTLFTGDSGGDFTGGSVNGAGDFNGDGIDDIIIGAQQADVGGNADAGKSYIIFGKNGGLGATFDLGNISEADGLIIDGAAAGDESGRQVSRAGDLNGDGIDDVVIGAHLADGNGNADAGQTYVVYGSRYYGTAVQSFDLTAFENSRAILIDRVDAGEMVVGASASSGASVTFTGVLGKGVTYAPSEAGTLSDRITITLENSAGDQRTQILNMTILESNRTLPQIIGDSFDGLLAAASAPSSALSQLSNPYTAASNDVFDFETGFGTATDLSGADEIDLADVAGVTGFGDLTITHGANALIDLGVTGGLDAGDFGF